MILGQISLTLLINPKLFLRGLLSFLLCGRHVPLALLRVGRKRRGVLVEPARVDFRAGEIRVCEDVTQKGDVGRNAFETEFAKRTGQP